MTRRRFIELAAIFGCNSMLNASTYIENFNSRELWLERPNTGEKLVDIFYKNGQYDMNVYARFCNLARDTHENISLFMDYKLLNVLWFVQSTLSELGFKRPIQINSGYRTPRTNNKLENAALNSYHLYGKAIDFRIPDVSLNTLYQLVNLANREQEKLDNSKIGGIGIYMNQNFMHVDTGESRIWKG